MSSVVTDATTLPKLSALGGRILVVDDEPINLRLVRRYLRDAGCVDVLAIEDPRQVLHTAREQQPHVILLDVVMPGISGLDVLRQLRLDPDTARIPVLILTANDDSQTRRQALENGATDFLTKPLDPAELIPRLRNTLISKQHEDSLRQQALRLEDEVRRRTQEIARTRVEIVHCLARAAEYRDNETGQHILRVGRFSAIIAEQLGLDRDFVELIELAAPLHDVGKIGIPDEILLKSGKLTSDEFEFMQKHTTMGARVFQSLADGESKTVRRHPEIGGRIFGEPRFELLKLAKVIAMTHHERMDGTGYPLGLAGADIPLAGRIVAVADVYDALSSKRPYKPAFPRQRCFEILEEGRGTHFDPQVLDAFIARAEDIVATQIELADL